MERSPGTQVHQERALTASAHFEGHRKSVMFQLYAAAVQAVTITAIVNISYEGQVF